MKLPVALRIVTAGVVVLAVTLTACTAANDHHTTSSSTAATNAPTVQETIRTLAGAGIATVSDESSTAPLQSVTGATVLTVTSWQVNNMTLEAAAHGGILGADLDTVAPTNGGPPLAFVISGWVATAADPTAVAAGRLLDNPDWYHADNVVFPLEVLDLFIADVLAHLDTAPSGTGSAPTSSSTIPSATTPPIPNTTAASTPDVTTSQPGLSPEPGSSSGLASPNGGGQPIEAAFRADGSPLDTGCSGIASFVDGVLSSVFNALKVDPTEVADWISGKLGGGVLGTVAGAIGGFFASFWNKAVDFAQAAVRNVLSALTAPVIDTLRTVIGALETITVVMSYLRRWSAPITPDPASNSFSVAGQSAHRGSFTMTIDRNSESADWPALLSDCATTLGKPVPTLSKEGAQVSWTQTGQENGLVSIDRPTGPPYTGALDAALSDRLDYTAGTEDAATAKGTLVKPTITVAAHVRRTEIDQLSDLLTDYLAQNFPPIIQPTIRAILASIFGWAKNALDKFTAVDGSATIEVSHHIKKPPPTPAPSPSCSATGTAIPAGTYTGPIHATLTTTMHLDVGGQTIPNAGGGTTPLDGTINLTSNGTTVTGTLALSGAGTAHVGLPGDPNVNSTDTGALTATISGPATNPVIDGTLSGAWASLDAPVINGSGSDSSPIHAGLHITRASCTSITGDAIALFRDIAAPVSQYLTIGGTGTWTAQLT